MLHHPPGPGDSPKQKRAERDSRQLIVKGAIEVIVFDSGDRALNNVAARYFPVLTLGTCV
jgi:hypothetical protein